MPGPESYLFQGPAQVLCSIFRAIWGGVKQRPDQWPGLFAALDHSQGRILAVAGEIILPMRGAAVRYPLRSAHLVALALRPDEHRELQWCDHARQNDAQFQEANAK